MVVFPLIWVGGLVTTFDAGMSVPDWPNTYGYNLFMYPYYDWFFGPWDLFVEHGHRLLASFAGLVTVILAVVAYKVDDRKWYRRLALVGVGLVILQGVLGGIRVVLDERGIALVHGCLGPSYFIVTVALWVCSSRWWFNNRAHSTITTNDDSDLQPKIYSKSFVRFTFVVLVLAFVQLVIGANLRHINEAAPPMLYQNLVVAHVLMAIGIMVASLMLATMCLGKKVRQFGFGKYGIGLILCVAAQITLGLGTWIVKFGWPYLLSSQEFAASFVVGEKSFLQMNVVTAHVAIGSLVLGILTFILCRSIRVTELQVEPSRLGQHSSARVVS